MFKKLLSNLPFNPSLIDQVAFYSKRLRKESAIRRLGFLLISIAFALQIFAVVKPTEASTQVSGNDVIPGGFNTREDAVRICRNNNQYGFGAILLYYGMTCDNLANASTQTISTNSQGDSLYSMGRIAYNKRGEYPVTIPAAGTLYLRHLSSWGIFNAKVLSMTTPDGQPFMVMYDCGNIVIKGHYTPPAHPAPASSLKLAKVNSPTGSVKPGDIINYTLAFANTGGTAAFFSVNDQLPDQVDFVSSEQATWKMEQNGKNLKWYNNTPPFYTFGNTDAFGTPGFIKLKVKVKDNVTSGTTICNKGWLIDVNTTTKQTQTWSQTEVCNTVVIECAPGTIPQNGTCITPSKPDAVCAYLKAEELSRTKFSFETKVDHTSDATISSYSYNFGDSSTQLIQSKADTNKTSHEYAKAGTYTITVKVATSVADRPSLSCQTKVTVSPDTKPVVTISKKASNLTKKVDDANGTTASPGDVIEYTLTNKNFGDGDATNRLLPSEAIGDILEYATLDFNSLGDGVYVEASKQINWPTPVTVKAGQSIVKKFKVTIKNPLPSNPQKVTPEGKALDGSFDLKMTNTYGNTVEIKLPTTPLKTTETTVNSLPNTGPGLSIGFGGVLTAIVGYFFARTRLMTRELDIVRSEYADTSGGL